MKIFFLSTTLTTIWFLLLHLILGLLCKLVFLHSCYFYMYWFLLNIIENISMYIVITNIQILWYTHLIENSENKKITMTNISQMEKLAYLINIITPFPFPFFSLEKYSCSLKKNAQKNIIQKCIIIHDFFHPLITFHYIYN